MIKVKIKDNKINVTGHANYADFGKDIVCASVSSVLICTINGILSIDKEAILVEEKEANVTIEIKKDNEIINKLINNMIDCFKELEINYPNNIKIIQ